MKKRQNKEEMFARAYLANGLNATQAAIAVGYSPKGADVVGVRLLGKARVKEWLARLSEQKLAKLDITAERILQELARLAFIDVGKLYDENDNLIPLSKVDEDTRRAIVGVDYEKLFEHFGKGQAKRVGDTVKVKMADKVRALELLGRYRKLFTDKVEVTGLDGLAEKLNKIRERK